MALNREAGRTCLMTGMADRLGVDPVVAVASGQIAAHELSAMQARCEACVRHDDCILWMVDRATADAAPGYCLNAEELSQLRK